MQRELLTAQPARLTDHMVLPEVQVVRLAQPDTYRIVFFARPLDRPAKVQRDRPDHQDHMAHPRTDLLLTVVRLPADLYRTGIHHTRLHQPAMAFLMLPTDLLFLIRFRLSLKLLTPTLLFSCQKMQFCTLAETRQR